MKQHSSQTSDSEGLFRSKDDINPIVFNQTFDFQLNKNSYPSLSGEYTDETKFSFKPNQILNKNKFARFYYFLNYKTTVSGITDSKGKSNLSSDEVSGKIKTQYDTDKDKRRAAKKAAKEADKAAKKG